MKKIIFCLFCFLFFVNLPVFAIDQTIKVKFKAGTNESQIAEILDFTNTKLKNKNGLDYVLEIKGIVTASKLDTYSELFLLLPMVKDVDPLPREKSSDNLSVVYQDLKKLPGRNEKEQVAKSDSSNQDKPEIVEQTVTSPQIKAEPTPSSGTFVSLKLTESQDILVSFRPGEGEKILEKFNRVFGTRLVAQKSFAKFILKLPPNISPKMALRALKLCPYVLNVAPLY